MTAVSFGARVNEFYLSLTVPRAPRGVRVMNPYADARTRVCVESFLAKYFDDSKPRTLIMGINPGRFGSGLTGVTFTDPFALTHECEIAHDFTGRRELSAEFIYRVVNVLGGPAAFYKRLFLSAVCPLGFTRKGINLNYYDDKRLEKAVTPFVVQSIESHLEFPVHREHVVILGRGKNLEYFRRLNDEHRWFSQVSALDHPRFIMQYRRKKLESYVDEYARLLDTISSIF
jgi:hypothetical protein